MSPDTEPRAGIQLRVIVPSRPVSIRVSDETREQFLARRARDLREHYLALGRVAGERKALSEAAGALQRAAESLENAARRASENVARDAVQLGVEIARTLLRHEIDAGHYDIERVVRETLQASNAGRGACVVHLNPADLARLEGIPFRAGTTLEADPEVAPADVHVTTQRGLLVRDVEQSIAAIAERLEGDVS